VLEGVIRGVAALERRLGAAGATKVVDEFRRVARDIAFKHDALEDRGDRDLDTVRLVVGLPLASEDDAGRTIRLALALVDALDGIGSDVEPELRLAIGIQRGAATVIRRGSASSFEVEATTAGFAAHLARFAGAAEILVGGRVFRSARAEWNFEALAAIDLPAGTDAGGPKVDEDTEPGIKRARVYRLRGPRSARPGRRERGAATTLFGRELELKPARRLPRRPGGRASASWRSSAITASASAPGRRVPRRRRRRRGLRAAHHHAGRHRDDAVRRDRRSGARDPRPGRRRRAPRGAAPAGAGGAADLPGEEDGREARAALAAVSVLLGRARRPTPATAIPASGGSGCSAS
jgi:hypothetical protein